MGPWHDGLHRKTLDKLLAHPGDRCQLGEPFYPCSPGWGLRVRAVFSD